MEASDIWVQLDSSPLNIGRAYSFLQTPAAGGIAIFVGTTRQWTGNRETCLLEYEAYDKMAENEMRRLALIAQERWAVERICLLHRVGDVPVSEASVVVGVSSAHRAPAFEACRYLIDMLKQRVPIWKAEHYADGSIEWIGGG